jgi:hypothetical protein
MALWSRMGDLGVWPRCSAEEEEGMCHFTVEVPQTRGMLVRSIIWMDLSALVLRKS